MKATDGWLGLDFTAPAGTRHADPGWRPTINAPAGKHQVTLSIADNNGRVGTRTFRFAIDGRVGTRTFRFAIA